MGRFISGVYRDQTTLEYKVLMYCTWFWLTNVSGHHNVFHHITTYY